MTQQLNIIFVMFLLGATFLPTLVFASSVFPGGYWGPLLSCVGNYNPPGSPNSPSGPVQTRCTSLCDLFATAENAINFLITVALYVLSPIFIMWGGFRMMFAAGSPEGFREGRRMLTTAIIGVVIVLFAYVIIDTFLWGLGVATGGGAAVSWPDIQCAAPVPAQNTASAGPYIPPSTPCGSNASGCGPTEQCVAGSCVVDPNSALNQGLPGGKCGPGGACNTGLTCDQNNICKPPANQVLCPLDCSPGDLAGCVSSNKSCHQVTINNTCVSQCYAANPQGCSTESCNNTQVKYCQIHGQGDGKTLCRAAPDNAYSCNGYECYAP